MNAHKTWLFLWCSEGADPQDVDMWNVLKQVLNLSTDKRLQLEEVATVEECEEIKRKLQSSGWQQKTPKETEPNSILSKGFLTYWKKL